MIADIPDHWTAGEGDGEATAGLAATAALVLVHAFRGARGGVALIVVSISVSLTVVLPETRGKNRGSVSRLESCLCERVLLVDYAKAIFTKFGMCLDW